MGATWVVVLAGGGSRRFGRDKLAADLGGRTLLDATLDAVPTDLPVLVVGPGRPVARPVRFVREEPPGGGPAAALVAGFVAALDLGADRVVSLPGDAPAAGTAVVALLDALGSGDLDLVVAVGADGQVFPLQVAATVVGVRRFVAAAGPGRGAGASVRRLLEPLGPGLVPLPAAALRDVDVPADLADLTRIGEDPTA